MEISVTTLAGKSAGKIKVSDAVFGLEPRADILQRMVNYQLAKKQQGSHQSKGRSDIARTGARLYRQKGTGKARHHAASAPQFRGGGKAHGPDAAQSCHRFAEKGSSVGSSPCAFGKGSRFFHRCA